MGDLATLTAQQEKLALYAARGLRMAELAAAFGWTEDRVKQELALPEVRSLYGQLKLEELERTAERELSLEDVEGKALKALERGLDSPRESLRAKADVFFKIAAVRDSRAKLAKGSNSDSSSQGKIQVPAFVNLALNIVQNAENQIVAINGRSLAPMPLSKLTQEVLNVPAARQEVASPDSDAKGPSQAKSAPEDPRFAALRDLDL